MVFLKGLALKNNRLWFQEHKVEYQRVQKSFEALLAAVIARVAVFDPSVAHVQPSDCMFRIYRDTRFSSDKSPYKNHIGGLIPSPTTTYKNSMYLFSFNHGDETVCGGCGVVRGGCC